MFRQYCWCTVSEDFYASAARTYFAVAIKPFNPYRGPWRKDAALGIPAGVKVNSSETITIEDDAALVATALIKLAPRFRIIS
jgi:hypothetical protein